MTWLPDAPAVDDIDFVDPIFDDGADEDLDQPPGRDLPGTPFQRRLLVAVLVIATLASVAVHGLLQRSAHKGPRPTTVLAGPVVSVQAPPVATGGGRVVHAPDPNTHRDDVEEIVPTDRVPTCPVDGDGQSACVTVRSVPGPVRAAVRAQFHLARVTQVRSEELRDTGPGGTPGLFSRTISATDDEIRISVSIRRGERFAPYVGTATSRLVVIFAQHRAGSLLVEVEVSAPGGWSLPAAFADRLARDPRLLTLP